MSSAGRAVAGSVNRRHRAGVVSRTIANTIDLLLAAVGSLVALALLASARYVALGPSGALPSWPGWLLGSGVSLLVVGYLAVGWLTTGRTPGKQVVGLRVVNRTGTPVRPGQAVLRAVICVAFPFGLLWALVSRRNLSLHDLAVRTAVVYDWSYARADPPASMLPEYRPSLTRCG